MAHEGIAVILARSGVSCSVRVALAIADVGTWRLKFDVPTQMKLWHRIELVAKDFAKKMCGQLHAGLAMGLTKGSQFCFDALWYI